MRIKYLTIILIVSQLVCGCSGEPPSTGGPTPHLLNDKLTSAAMDTVLRYNSSEMRETSLPAEIPREFWARDIEDLKPLKVYWHNNNLAVVLRDSSSQVVGVYIYVPISSYRPMGDTIQLTFGQESYTFTVKQ